MHPALLVPDVVDCIFTFICKEADRQTRNRTFAALARTCSALSEPSLDTLWSELHSLYPLMSCIYDSNAKLCDEACFPYSHVSPQAEPLFEQRTDADLSVFLKYAYRVRKLIFGCTSGWVPTESATAVTDHLGAIHVLHVPTPLLPNLNHLVWADGLSLPLLLPLLNPRLISLRMLSIQWSPKFTPLFLSKIPGFCPELRSLTMRFQLLEGFSDQTLAASCLSRVIGSWKKLEVLHCNPTGCGGILSLSLLSSSLKILQLQVDNSSVMDLPANSLSFPSLQTFRFSANNLGTAFSLLQAMRSLPKSIEIDLPMHQFGDVGDGTETVELIPRLIAQVASCDILEEFRMRFSTPGAIPFNICDMLRPLFVCCNLRTLRLAV